MMLSRSWAAAEGVATARGDVVTSWTRDGVVEDAQWLVEPLEARDMWIEVREESMN